MSIEFRCSECGRLLRTPEGTAGRQAKCPQCGALSTIPAPETVQAAAGPAGDLPRMSAPPDSANPYQSPLVDHMQPSAPVQRGFNPTRIDLGDVMSRTWQIYKGRLWPLVGTTLLFLVVGQVVGQMVGYVSRGSGSVPVVIVLNIFNYAVSTFLTVGLMTYMLNVARGQETTAAELFGAGPLLLPALGISILYTLAAVVGFILLIIPGIIVLLMFSQSYYLLIDQQTGVIESMRLSAQTTSGNKLMLFVLGLAAIGLMLMGFLALCIGIFFVYPYIFLMSAVAYLVMTGQGTAADGVQLAS